MDGGILGRFGRPPLADRLRAAGVREDLVQAAGLTVFGRQGDDEVASLPALLTADEVVLQLLEGRCRRTTGLLVLTTRRILFRTSARHRQAPLILDRSDVLSASSHAHRGLSALTITTATGDVVVDRILGTQAESFTTNVLRAPAESPVADPLVELAQLRALHRAGAIADAEFEARKRQLFEQI